MDTPSQRLDKVCVIAGIEVKKGKLQALSEKIDISIASLYNFSKRKTLSADVILAIIQANIPVSTTYLKTGEGDAELNDSGISNYGHSARAYEVAEAYENMNNDDQKLFYLLAMRLKDKNDFSFLDEDVQKMGK